MKTLRPKTTLPRLFQYVGLMVFAMLLALPFHFVSAAPMFVVATNGDGNLTVTPSSLVYGSAATFDFVFTADTGDFSDTSQLVISIPDGWTPPSLTLVQGRVTLLSHNCTLRSPGVEIAGVNSTSPMSILVDFGCAQGETFTVRYASAKAPASALYTFTATTDIPGASGGPAELVSGSPTVDVTPKPITVGASALSANNKIYDGTTDATITIGDSSLVGVEAADVGNVSLDASAWTAFFADKNAANGKLVTIDGLALTGSKSTNYSLVQPTRTANITKLPITITAVTDSKVYDGTTNSSGVPVLSAGTPLAVGDVEPVWTQSFDNKNAGTGKSLTPAGLVNDGNGGLNYAYNYVPVATGEIIKLPITVTAVTDSKVYDGTTSSSGLPILSVGTPLAAGDSEPAWTQTFDTKNIGTNKTLTPAGLVVDGNNGLNYDYNFVTVSTGEITAKPITVTADSKTKAFGAPDPAFTYQVAPSLAFGDSFTGALDRDPGAAPGVYNINQGTLSAGANYSITYVGATLTINPKISGNAGAAGVTLNYNDGGPKSVISNSSGAYSLVVSYGWSGMVTPSKSGYSFLPASTTYSNVTANLASQNYVARMERIQNGGFNVYSGLSKIPQLWSASGFSATDGKTTTVKKEGVASVVITGQSGTNKSLTQTIVLSGGSGDQFSFSFWAKGDAIPVAGICRAQVIFYNGATVNLTKTVNCTTGTYGFQKKLLSFSTAAAYTKIVVKFMYTKSSGTVWFDLVSLVR